MTPPELSRATIRRFCRDLIPPEAKEELRIEMTVRADAVTIWERRPPTSPNPASDWTSTRVAQLRYDRRAKGWTIYWPRGKTVWHLYDERCLPRSLDDALTAIGDDPLGVFFG